MAKQVMKERTVGFYEVVREESAEQVRFEQADWEGFLGGVAGTSLADRTLETDRQIIGQTYPLDEHYHLLVHRVKDPGEWLSRVNFETEQFEDIEQQANEGYLDTSVASFLGYGNLVGMIQGAPASPGHKALENWLNGMKPFSGASIVVRPVMAQAAIEKLKRATGITTLEIRLGQSKAATLAGKSGRLANALRRLSEDYGDVRVQLRISVPRGKARHEDRIALLNDLSELSDVVPGSADVARAGLIFGETDVEGKAQLAELVEHHITAKRRVPAIDEEGKSIRIAGAARAILNAADEYESDLRLIADLG
jgi:hypothetical protein